MQKTMFIKPAPGREGPRDPVTLKRLAATGEKKPVNTFWLRRLKSGEVINVEANAEPVAAPRIASTKTKGA